MANDDATIDISNVSDRCPKTVQYTITMPLIPSYKTEVAKYCRNPSNGITGGFIRWQSMNTIYGIKLDCLCQGETKSLMEMPNLLRRFAVDILRGSTGLSDEQAVPPMEVTQQEFKNVGVLAEFSIGSTPHKVMDVWRKERQYVQQSATGSVPPSSRRSHSSEDILSGGILEPNSPEENEPGSFYSERAIVHRLWVEEARYAQRTSTSNSSSSPTPVATWRPNSHSNNCFSCHAAFGIWRRKHHCRRCGELVCSACSPGTGPGLNLKDAPEAVGLELQKNVPQRICSQCESKLRAHSGSGAT